MTGNKGDWIKEAPLYMVLPVGTNLAPRGNSDFERLTEICSQ